MIGLLTSAIQGVLTTRLQCRYVKLQQISSLKKIHLYQQQMVLNQQSKIESKCWIVILDLYNGRS